jgi:hypothetical protein
MTVTFNPRALEQVKEAVFTGLVEASVQVLALNIKSALEQEFQNQGGSSGQNSATLAPDTGASVQDQDAVLRIAQGILVMPQEDQVTVLVGSLDPGAFYLETGTERTPPRPIWLNTALTVMDQMAHKAVEIAQDVLAGSHQPCRDFDVNVNPEAVETAVIPHNLTGGTNG